MSLKAVHLIFVSALSALAFGSSCWKFRDFFRPEGRLADLFFGIGALLVGVAVIFYGRYFLKKFKKLGYL